MGPSLDTKNGTDNWMQSYVQFWTDFFQKNTEQSQQWFAAMVKSLELDRLRRPYSQAISAAIENFMRTPAFLEAFSRALAFQTGLKNLMENWLRDLAATTGLPRTEDVSGLFERLHLGQEAILKRLDQLEKRLQTLEERPSGKRSKSEASSSGTGGQ